MFSNNQDNYKSKKDELVDRATAARLLGLKTHTLAVWAITNKESLPYVKIGRLVRYRMQDIEKFIESNLKNKD